MKISIVISLYNEEEGVVYFWQSLKESLSNYNGDENFELIWVNDGSRDNTQFYIDNITKETLPNAKHQSVQFVRNFGHEAAMIAGIDNASGDAIICLDSDGQHPPEKIAEMVASFKSGNDVILMQRVTRNDKNFSNLFSNIFYTLINYLSEVKFRKNSSDFFLISKGVASVLKEYYRDQTRFIRGFIQSLGFNTKILEFNAPSRNYGVSHYNFFSLIKLAFNAIFSFSNKPLRISIIFSILFLFVSLVFSIFTVYNYITMDAIPSGYTTIVIFLSISFSLLFFSIAIISLYLEKMIKELKNRPLYIIKK